MCVELQCAQLQKGKGRKKKENSPRYLIRHNGELLYTERIEGRIEGGKKSPEMAHSGASANFLGALFLLSKFQNYLYPGHIQDLCLVPVI